MLYDENMTIDFYRCIWNLSLKGDGIRATVNLEMVLVFIHKQSTWNILENWQQKARKLR